MTQAIASIYCWVIFLPMVFLTIGEGIPSAIIITYISHISCGAGINGNSTLWLWSEKIYDQHIRFQSDYMNVISYIMSMGGCRSNECDRITKETRAWVIDYNIWLPLAYIPDKQKVVGDKLSREFNIIAEWQLK